MVTQSTVAAGGRATWPAKRFSLKWKNAKKYYETSHFRVNCKIGRFLPKAIALSS
jgi:hypothetical protein